MEGFYIVTGGVSGLGEETSRVLFQSGACVSLFDRDDKKGEELVQRWNKMKTANPTFGEVFFIKVDVTSEVDVKNAIRESLKKFGEKKQWYQRRVRESLKLDLHGSKEIPNNTAHGYCFRLLSLSRKKSVIASFRSGHTTIYRHVKSTRSRRKFFCSTRLRRKC
eukprot:TRINITY_DN2149_c0_g1_i3.p1 TRINITY_DN2149_c0_g1~~TRINITY_DN2149_c0_g1_i3.p1  ORF type:complete len:164 (+),score=29.49 TRINITY_DN2149_c0_g1_i3:71-562(+)